MRITRLLFCLLVVAGSVAVARPAAAVDPTVSVDDVTVVEEDGGVGGMLFTVTVAGDRTGSVSVQYRTSDVSATAQTSGNCGAGFDYLEAFGGLSFSSTESEKTVLVTSCGDTRDEPDETFSLELHTPSSGLTITGGTGTGTILDDDDPPRLTVSGPSVTEGNSGTVTATFTVQLSTESGRTVTFDFATRNPTSGAIATAGTSCASGVDYRSATGSRTIAAGSRTPSQAVSVSVCGDTLDEANERFALGISNLVNATPPSSDALATITDDDTISLSVADILHTEGNTGTTNARFTIRLSTTTSVEVRVDYATGQVKATGGTTCGGGVDFLNRSGEAVIAAGTTTAAVDVPVCGDVLDEANEGFNLDLSGATGATISDSRGVATVVDNDPLPVMSLTDNRVQAEGSTARNLQFNVRLDRPSGRPVHVDFATAAGPSPSATAGTSCGSGVDYVGRSGTLTFAPGDTAEFVIVQVCGDGTAELDERFDLRLSNVINASIATADTTSRTTLANDDGPAVSVGDVSVAEGDSGVTSSSIALNLSGPAGPNGVRVTLVMQPGTGVVLGDSCTSGVDIPADPPTALMTLDPGETSVPVPFEVCGDLLVEGNEQAFVDIIDVDFGVIGDGRGVVTVLNDDDGNVPPIADAGGDQRVGSGQAITLDGTGSTDPEGGPLGFLWTQIDGPEAVLRDETEAEAHVDGVRGPATLTFQVRVTDGAGDTDTDTVVITVNAPK